MAKKKSLFPKPRKPSLNRMLGISSFKSKVTKATGGRAARDPKVFFKNAEKRAKRKMGFVSPSEWWRKVGKKPRQNKSEPKGCWPFRF
jgi:hypothetical protein